MRLPRPQPLTGRFSVTLLLDALFAVWMLHVLVTGNVIPTPLAELIHPPAPIAVVTDPDGAPHDRDRLIESRPEV